MCALQSVCCAWGLSLCHWGHSFAFRAKNLLRMWSLCVSLETFVSFSAYFVFCSASSSRPRRQYAEPCASLYDPSCVVLWNEELQLGHKGNGAFQDNMPPRVFSVQLAIAAVGSWWPGNSRRRTPSQNQKSFGKKALLDVRPRAFSVVVTSVGTGVGGPSSDISDTAFHIKDVMDMDRDELI